MKRSQHFDMCESMLNHLCLRVRTRGKLNLLNLNVHCEDFYLRLLNLIFGYKLTNLNAVSHNAEGVDLIDPAAKVVLQVSGTATVQKINLALAKDLSAYKDHKFNFVVITEDASKLRTKAYENPHGLNFDPKGDIHDVVSLLKAIQHMEVLQQREVYQFLKDELGFPSETKNPESNLAAVIGIIAKLDLSATGGKLGSVPFNVDDKLTTNQLKTAASVIEDYKIHHANVDRIYSEFDIAGKNRSKSVLDSFRKAYLKLKPKLQGDALYFQIIEDMMKLVRESSNYEEIAIEELDLCVNVLAVDAFIRCKIFEPPAGTSHALA